MSTQDSLLTPEEFSKLRWRCRRGLLENDLFITRYLQDRGSTLTVRDAHAIYALMDLSDNDLLDILLRRCEPRDALANPDVLCVVEQMRNPPAPQA